MAEDLTKLFGSVLEEGAEPSPISGASTPPPSGHAPSGESGGVGTSTQSPKQKMSNSVLTYLLYVTSDEAMARCMGYIGKSKFCVTTACTTQKHDQSKFHPKAGLYIRVPKRSDQCFCEPFLPDNLFESEVSAEFLSSERSVEEWSSIFAAIKMQGVKLSSTDWEDTKVRLKKIKEFTTPKKFKLLALSPPLIFLPYHKT